MSDTTTAPAPAPSPTTGGVLALVDWNMAGRWVAVVALAVAVLALELTNHADKGTFIDLVAKPGFAGIGVWLAAKHLT